MVYRRTVHHEQNERKDKKMQQSTSVTGHVVPSQLPCGSYSTDEHNNLITTIGCPPQNVYDQSTPYQLMHDNVKMEHNNQLSTLYCCEVNNTTTVVRQHSIIAE